MKTPRALSRMEWNMRTPLSFLCILITTFGLLNSVQAAESIKPTAPRGRPELTDLIRDISPVVVSISIEKPFVSTGSRKSQTVFKPRIDASENKQSKDKLQSDSLGSGFFCDSKGHVVTNAHVVEGAGQIIVTLPGGQVVKAHVVAVHPKVDLALIKVDGQNDCQRAQLGDSSNVKVGEWVLAVGNPFGLGKTVTVGIVSGMGRFLGLGPDDNFIQTDAAINPGNSGGPLFNMGGEVIGINTAIIASGKGIGFSIPSNYVNELLKIQHEKSLQGWLGIFVEDMSDEEARKFGLKGPRGTFVDEVVSSAPAYLAGLRKGDLILNADGKSVENSGHLSKIVSSSKPGDMVQMRVLRGRSVRNVNVVVGKAPE